MAASVRQAFVINASFGGSSSSASGAFPLPILAGNTIVVFFGAGTDGVSQTYTGADSRNAGAYSDGAHVHTTIGGSDYSTFRFYKTNCAAGATTVTITGTSAELSLMAWVLEIDGSDGNAPIASGGQIVASPGTGTDAVSSGTLSAPTQPGLIVGFALDGDETTSNVPVFGTGFTSNGTDTTTVSSVESKRITSTGSNPATFTAGTGNGSDNFFVLAYIFAELAAAPTINTQPVSQDVPPGKAPTFTVSATASAGSLTYQWFKNGSSITGATSSTYTPAPLLFTDNQAFYRCDVTDSNGTTSTINAWVTISAPLLRRTLFTGMPLVPNVSNVIVATASGTASGSATITGKGVVAAIEADGAATGIVTTNGKGPIVASGSSASSGTSTLVGAGIVHAEADGVATGSGVLTATGTIHVVEADGTASGTVTATGKGTISAVQAGATSTGIATISGPGKIISESDGAASGAGTLVGAGTLIVHSDGAASAIAVLTGLGVFHSEADGTSSDTAVLHGAGAFAAEADGVSSGDATLTVAEQLVAESDGTSSGAAVVTATGSIAAESDSSSSAAVLIMGTGIMTAESDASSTGAVSAVVGIGQSSAEADGEASVAAFMTGIGTIGHAQASCASSGDVDFNSSVLHFVAESDGTSSGSADLSAAGTMSATAAGATSVDVQLVAIALIAGDADCASTGSSVLDGLGSLGVEADGASSGDANFGQGRISAAANARSSSVAILVAFRGPIQISKPIDEIWIAVERPPAPPVSAIRAIAVPLSSSAESPREQLWLVEDDGRIVSPK